MTRVLLADAEKEFRESLAEALRNDGCSVASCASEEEARTRLAGELWDVFLIGLHTPGMKGLEFIREARKLLPAARVIVLTAQGSIEEAVQALRLGAEDYLPKPMGLDPLLKRIAPHLRPPEARDERGNPVCPTFAGGVPTGLVGTSRAMRDLGRLISKVAPGDSTLLITGETGTGKDLVARALHRTSPRRDRPFIAVNCSAIPGTLLESQLFGHVQGAFTGADRTVRGFFEVAEGGTLFLDELGELPLSLQPKLLRVLDAREFWPLGSSEPRQVSARIIAATNRDLKAQVATGLFRQDLYFRLATLEIAIAPLRDRPEDVAVTAQELLARLCRSRRLAVPTLSPGALSALEEYSWPGNVRELSNVLERALVLLEGTQIGPGDLPPHLTRTAVPPGSALRSARKTFERIYMLRMLDTCGGDKAQAAKALGISLSSFYRLTGLPRPTSGAASPTPKNALRPP